MGLSSSFFPESFSVFFDACIVAVLSSFSDVSVLSSCILPTLFTLELLGLTDWLEYFF